MFSGHITLLLFQLSECAQDIKYLDSRGWTVHIIISASNLNVLIPLAVQCIHSAGGFTAQGGNLSAPPEKIAMKILYSPQTNITDSVIRKASRTFNTFQYIRDTAEDIVNCSDFFLQNYPAAGNQVEQIRQVGVVNILR